MCIPLKQRTAFPGASWRPHFIFCCPKCCLCSCLRGMHSHRPGAEGSAWTVSICPPGLETEQPPQTHGHPQRVDSWAKSMAPIGRRNGRQAGDVGHPWPPLKQTISVRICYRKHWMNIRASLMSLFSSWGVLALFE